MRLKHLLLTIGLFVLLTLQVQGQISPGPLSRPHHQFEGVGQCVSCHDFGAHSRSFKCLECHVEIQHRIQAHSGYHSRVYKPSLSEADCVRCHMEHNGEKFMLVRLEQKGFDHAGQTGFALDGKHASLACEKCHTSKNIADTTAHEIKVRDLNRTFLGLRRECTSCHEDVHHGQEGAECSRCHQQESWHTVPGFNHAGTAFPLTGLHQSVACEKCHTQHSGAKSTLFKGLPYAGCQSCHADPHHGAFREAKFQGSCENCHNTSGWKSSRVSAAFDHNSTKFALVGKHAELSCSRCHKDGDFHRPVPHDRCSACHEDPHKGQFEARASGSDCSACHTQTSYRPALFDRNAHQHSAFPLNGKHAALQCSECHQPVGRGAVYITRKVVCSACHKDQHNGQFVAAPYENKCDLCHTQTGFEPSTFSSERHAQTKFPLSGKHASVQCNDCHKPLAVQSATVIAAVSPAAVMPLGGNIPAHPQRQYRFPSETCNACHTDPHQTKLSCETCHVAESWNSVNSFNHAVTKFKIDGAHDKVPCTQCHSGTPPKFPVESSHCSVCHAAKDIHAGQFQSADRGEDCSTCHITAQWTMKVFNHDRAQFALDIAHRNVACEKCHKERKNAAGTMIRVYRGTPTECVKCH